MICRKDRPIVWAEPKERENNNNHGSVQYPCGFRDELVGRSGFAELLFAEECEETDADDELHDQSDPEPSFA